MPEIIAGTYEVIEKIGAGGGGVVYLANHLRLNKKVILKADKRKITTRPELLRREVDVLKNLHHPYIPQVYDFFVEGEIVYTAMDYIEGESLDHPLKCGKTYSQAQVIKWGRQLLQALDYLHSPVHGNPPRGYTHSDIKPANLMCTPQNDIVLIDFNIALALGEENVIGRSPGYASPEHYGIDFSEGESTLTSTPPVTDGKTVYVPSDEVTALANEETAAAPSAPTTSSFSKVKVITPDVRSDIYSVGATLYHLLGGQRPAINAKEVARLSEDLFSPQVVAIIAKAMEPNPDRRYQSAAEMLAAFDHLWENDPRTKRLKRNRLIVCALCSGLLVFGAVTTFVGLKRMQTTESWLKLAEYSANALREGDTDAAISYALQALPSGGGILTPPLTAQAQKSLTDALAVYDLSDGYKVHSVVELPSAPLDIALAPDGKTAACLYSGAVAIVDTDDSQILATLPADGSALAEVKYLNNSILLYAGVDGLQAYSIDNTQILWTGLPATGICLSENGACVAGVYRDEDFATVYDAFTGQILATVDFGERHQKTAYNDIFVNPNDNLFALSPDAAWLAASFSDGSLKLFNLTDSEKDVIIFDTDSGYTHFEGGFYQQYFAFSASNAENSIFVVLDMADLTQTGGFESDGPFGVQVDKTGIYLQNFNILIRIDPITGDQIPLVTTPQTIRRFAHSDTHTLIATSDSIQFFDQNAQLTATFEKTYECNFLQIECGVALVGSWDTPIVRILTYENHSESEILTYDTRYLHEETRFSANGERIMQFQFDRFRVYDKSGSTIAEVNLPQAEQVYDQQFRREGDKAWLEVLYYDGTMRCYDAQDGSLISETTEGPPDETLYEEFLVKNFRVASPLHGTPTVYDAKSGREVATLNEDAYLTYVNEAGPYIIAQYTTTDGYHYGQLLNENCEILADLPYLCDVVDETLYFDYPTGNVRQSRIFNIDDLRTLAQNHIIGGM